jgi:O-antigen ligase
MDNSGISILLEFALWTLAVSLPLAFVFYSIEDKKLFLANSIKYSRVILMLAVVSFYFMNDNQVYVISLSYSMLLPLIFIILRKDELKTRFDSILILLSVLTLILFGARGPLLGLGYAILIKVINDKRRFSFISLLRIFTIVLIVGIYIVYFNEINAYILKILDSFDIYARTFRKFLSGSFTDTTGRDDLWVYYIGLIKEKPLLGWGISGGWISRGDGPHNGIIDIYLAHGMVIGTLATIMFIYMLSLPFVDRSLRNNTVYIAYAAVNIPLLVSAGDLWIKFNLFIFVAVFIHITKKTKKKEKIVQTI